MPRFFQLQPRRSGERVTRVGAGDYKSRWRLTSERFRKRFPFCVECDRAGRIVFADLVDHKYPVADGGPMFPGENGLMGLCAAHHSGWKARLEAYARDTDQMDRIVEWCDRPETRPKFRGEIR